MRIFILESKQLMKARTTWVLLALALALSLLLAWMPSMYCYSSYTDGEGNEIILTGLASHAYEKAAQADAAGAVTAQRVREAVEKYRACLARYGVKESYDLPGGVYEREILPYAPLLHGVKEAFADPNTGMAPSLMEIDLERLDNFYAVCEERVASLMRMEQPGHPAAQEKAIEMYRQVEKPFEVYPGFNSVVMDYQNILAFLVLLFCVVIAAPAFSGGYQSGADDILRCTRHGRARLGVARAAAALCVSGAAFLLCSAVYVLASNALFGWERTGTSIQMVYSIATLVQMTAGELQWFFVLAGLLSVLASVSFTVFLSSRCRTTVASLTAALVVCIAPVVVCMAVPGEASDWLCAFLPASGVSIQASILYAITDFRFLDLGGFAVWVPYAMIAAGLVEIPLFFFLAVRAYCRHTV